MDATKRRIIDAATVEYSINGIPDTSMQAVARRADVAPGTVLYHYPDPDDLTEAVVESWLEDMEPPSADAISPDDPVETRIGRLVSELYGLYERSEMAYRIYSKSPQHPVLDKYESWWEENVGQMMHRALGERVTDDETVRVISVLVNPGFRGTLVSTGIDPGRAVEIAARMAVDWLQGSPN